VSLKVLNGPTIHAGESLSDAIDCSEGEVVRVTMPAEWTTAPLTYQISTDGEFYNDLFDRDGYEIKIPVVPADVSRAIAFLKIRSGSRASPVVQPSNREFAVAIKTSGTVIVPPTRPHPEEKRIGPGIVRS
jgi:hypothetical protein